MTLEASYGQKDIITPRAGRFNETLTWILDSTTGLPVGVRAAYNFTDSTFGKPWDNDATMLTAGPLEAVAKNPIPVKFL